MNLMARPEKPIDWKLVDRLLMSDCKGTEIAPHFDMHVNTFYLKVQEEHNVGFSEYSLIKKEHGDSLLRDKQYQKALKGEGDNVQLIWLGKQRLGQKEHFEDPIAPVNDRLLKLEEKIIVLMHQLTEEKKKNGSLPEANPVVQSSDPQV